MKVIAAKKVASCLVENLLEKNKSAIEKICFLHTSKKEIETEQTAQKISLGICKKVVLIFDHVFDKRDVENFGKLSVVF